MFLFCDLEKDFGELDLMEGNEVYDLNDPGEPVQLQYKGLTGHVGVIDVFQSFTLNQVIDVIADQESLPANYYSFSVYQQPEISTEMFDADCMSVGRAGITSGSIIICSPQPASDREARQIQKLQIAQVKRQARISADPEQQPFYRYLNFYDRFILPARYVVNDPVVNANPDGLVLGRPWIDFKAVLTGDLELRDGAIDLSIRYGDFDLMGDVDLVDFDQGLL